MCYAVALNNCRSGRPDVVEALKGDDEVRRSSSGEFMHEPR